MNRFRTSILTICLILISVFPLAETVNAQTPVVHAVLFYSPSCGHCQIIIDTVLPELDQKYGSQLVILGVNTYSEEGNTLFTNYVDKFNIPAENQAVPTLVVGDQYLIGSKDIPELFPGIVEEGLINGGIDWPDIDGIQEFIGAPSTGEVEETPSFNHKLTLWEKFNSDLEGNILAVVVLAGMLVALVFAGINLSKGTTLFKKSPPGWLIPLLAAIGISVAGYLGFVEINQVEAVCGPVGNCNAVQESEYAILFGILPIGVLGIMGYLVIIIIWLASLLDLPDLKRNLNLIFWVVTLFGTLFSIYLTFLEPFVIGATCIWCVSSAVIMTVLFLLATGMLQDPIEEPET